MSARFITGIVERQAHQPINQWVYELLWAIIIELHLEPGGPLNEIEAADALGVSRTPVREAFIKLVKDGLLHVIPQKGSIVSEIDLDQARPAWFVRRSAEKSVLSEACESFPEENLRGLEANVLLQEECFEKKAYDRFLVAGNDFHRIVYQGCDKERIWLEVIKKLDFNYDRLRIMMLPHMTPKVIDDHKAMLQIISEKDRHRIDEIIEQHLTWTVIDKVVEEYPPRCFKPAARRGNQN